jgi:hypothetical protein
MVDAAGHVGGEHQQEIDLLCARGCRHELDQRQCKEGKSRSQK